MLNRDDRARVVRGQVFYDNQWISIEEKEARENEFRKRIEQGYVIYQGEWMTIEDKLARVKAVHAPPQQATPQNVYYNPTINRQVYNVDNRNYQQTNEQHRHVHLDPNAPPPNWAQLQAMQQGGYGQALPPQTPIQKIPQDGQPGLPPMLEQKLPREAPDYFYGEGESEVKPPFPPPVKGDENPPK